MVPTWSKDGPNMVLISKVAGLEVKLGQTWSQNGPDMVLKNRHSIEMVLRPFVFSVKIFSIVNMI